MVKGIHEGLEGIKEIRILGKESYFHECSVGCEGLFDQSFNQFPVGPNGSTLPFGGGAGALCCVLGGVGTSPAILKTLHRGSSGDPRLVWRSCDPLDADCQPCLQQTLTNLRFNRDAVSRLYADVQQLPCSQGSIVQRQSNAATSQFLKLQLKDIGYRYPNTRQDALRDLNLEIRAGESIGLMGTSGSGKTTLVDVLLGLLESQDWVQWNTTGTRCRRLLSEWRSQVAYLPQQVFLIDNTLRCNVALGEEDQEIDESRLQAALRLARLSELVEQLPQGVNTILGERGVRLSGGQRQRVALARAFYHGRSVLVMDEATSALDNETEREIVAEIQRLKGQKTMIVIAHRLTTVQHCDRIYRLEQGRFVEEGTPEQVLQKTS